MFLWDTKPWVPMRAASHPTPLWITKLQVVSKPKGQLHTPCKNIERNCIYEVQGLSPIKGWTAELTFIKDKSNHHAIYRYRDELTCKYLGLSLRKAGCLSMPSSARNPHSLQWTGIEIKLTCDCERHSLSIPSWKTDQHTLPGTGIEMVLICEAKA